MALGSEMIVIFIVFRRIMAGAVVFIEFLLLSK
jgi:hypothetical protein